MRNAGPFLLVVIVLLCMFGAVSCKVNVWKECRTDHSFAYCWHLISK